MVSYEQRNARPLPYEGQGGLNYHISGQRLGLRPIVIVIVIVIDSLPTHTHTVTQSLVNCKAPWLCEPALSDCVCVSVCVCSVSVYGPLVLKL